MLLRPLNDRLIVKRAAEASMTPGGLFIPDPAKEKPIQGTVVSVGPGKVLDGKVVALDIQPGDTVLFGKYAGTEVTVDREELLILREDDVLAVVQAED